MRNVNLLRPRYEIHMICKLLKTSVINQIEKFKLFKANNYVKIINLYSI